MIQSFRHKGLKRFYEKDDRSKLPAELIRKIGTALAALDEAHSVEDMNQPTYRLHALKGDLAGFWSITISGNWRIIFRFEGVDALDVDFVDYH